MWTNKAALGVLGHFPTTMGETVNRKIPMDNLAALGKGLGDIGSSPNFDKEFPCDLDKDLHQSYFSVPYLPFTKTVIITLP